MKSAPLVIELFAGSFGWSAGFLAEGYRSVGFDIVHEPYHGPVPDGAELVLQDVLTLHGSQFKDAAVIVCSPPCQEYSYMAMPWTRAKAKAAWYREDPIRQRDLTALFDSCFRIQREAIEATQRFCPQCKPGWPSIGCGICNGHGFIYRHIPLIVENVKGAQPWVGRAAWHYGSFFLWGNVPALMPVVSSLRKSSHIPAVETPPGTGKTSWFFGNSKHENRNYGVKVPSDNGRRTDPGKGARFTTRDCGIEAAIKNNGGSWFAVAHNTTSGHGQNPDGRKVPGLDFSKYGSPGYKAQGFNTTAAQRYREGTKQEGSGPIWFDTGIAKHSSCSDSRKAASAQIARIPFALANHIARVYKPANEAAA